MLFSDASTAKVINDHFEPVWISVRDVPKFTLDFGNGKVIHRTIYGNTATIVTTADDTVLDVLPGLYDPAIYRENLKQVAMLATYANESGHVDSLKLHEYHSRSYNALKSNHFAPVLKQTAGGIAMASSQMKLPTVPSENDLLVERPDIKSNKEVHNWNALRAESTYNEAVRRKHIHQYLAGTATKHGDLFTKWVYKEVLHADLDDPYLGLGPVLFAAYPFKD